MDDGSSLTGAYTFTNASAIVQGNSSADTSEIKVGDIVIDDNGDKVRVKISNLIELLQHLMLIHLRTQ